MFVLNYLYSTAFDKKANHLKKSLQGVNADLLGQYATDTLIGDVILINLPASKEETLSTNETKKS